MTDWKEHEGGPTLGLGLHTFLRDEDPLTLLEWRELHAGPTIIPHRIQTRRSDAAMSRLASEDGITPSIIDRLIDPEFGRDRVAVGLQHRTDDGDGPARRRGPAQHAPRRATPFPPSSSRRNASVLAYGLPDLVSYYGLGRRSSGHRQPVDRGDDHAIRAPAPRRPAPQVLTAGNTVQELRLEFRITAKLCVEPSPEVSFVTVLQLTTGQASVQPGGE